MNDTSNLKELASLQSDATHLALTCFVGGMGVLYYILDSEWLIPYLPFIGLAAWLFMIYAHVKLIQRTVRLIPIRCRPLVWLSFLPIFNLFVSLWISGMASKALTKAGLHQNFNSEWVE